VGTTSALMDSTSSVMGEVMSAVFLMRVLVPFCMSAKGSFGGSLYWPSSCIDSVQGKVYVLLKFSSFTTITIQEKDGSSVNIQHSLWP